MTQPRAFHPVNSIRVGERHRHDMGDIAGLASSIKEVGLLHPIVITPNGTLIAGERRLAAFKLLSRAEIPVNVVDLKEIVRGEFAENKQRKDFLPSEDVAIARAVDALERAAAKARQGTRTDQHPAKLAEGQKGAARDKVAAYTGRGRTSLAKAEEVVKAAEAEPERFAPLVAEMDRTGKVDGAYRKLQQKKDEGRRLAIMAGLHQADSPGKFPGVRAAHATGLPAS